MIKNKPKYNSTFNIQHIALLWLLLLSIAPLSTVSAQFPLALDTLLPGDTLEIYYDVGVKNLAGNVTEVSSQVKVSGSNFSDVVSDDPDNNGSNMDPTVTPACPTPEAAFDFTVCGLDVMFIDQSPAASSWLWDFGDANTSTMQSPKHTYAVAGTYTVCLTVTTSCGADSVCKTVVTCDPAVAGFTSVINAKEVTFTNTSNLATSYLWDFGDGNTSTMASPIHTYASNGDYTVSLIAFNNCKNDTMTQLLLVCDLAPGIVFNTMDDGCGSLRRVVAQAAPGDTIEFDSSIDGMPVLLDSQIVLNKNLVIIGNDTTRTIIDGQQLDRIFEISSGDSVYLDGLVIQNGSTQDGGGGVLNFGHLEISNVLITGNQITMGGASDVGGGIYNDGVMASLIVQNSCISNNQVVSRGGGIYNNMGLVVLNQSIISGNSVIGMGGFSNGGGIYNRGKVIGTSVQISSNEVLLGSGAGVYNLDSVTFLRSVISGNTAGNSIGGGILNSGVAIFKNTLISGNTAGLGGGGIWNIEDIILDNTTVTGNKAATDGGGICITTATSSAELTNSIISLNIAPNGPDIQVDGGSTINSTHCIIGDPTGDHFIMNGANGNQVGTVMTPLDPSFEMNVDTTTLPNESGDLRLQCNSPAIDAGTVDTTGLNVGPTDFGGGPRIIDNIIDIGAYEAGCQEIQVFNNGVSIDSVDVTPSSADGTDFKEVCGMTMDSFYIKNVRDGNLIIDTIKIDAYGSNAGAFSFNESDFTFPDTIIGGDSVLLKIIFDPIISGIDTAVVCIGNNDSDEDPFTFLVSGTLDTTAPIAACQDLTIFLDKSGNASITADEIDNGSTDNCGIETYVLDKSTYTCADLGMNTVVLTVTDSSGNSDTCHAIVTVEDIPISTIPHIVGLSPFCPGMTNTPYSVVPDSDVTSYQWSYSGSGATILNNGSPSINISFAANASAGTLTVEYFTACGPSGIKDNFSVVKASEFTCNLAFNCPETLIVINTMINFPAGINLFKANANVLSAATVETDETVLFRSGSEINLLPNFEVELGAVFGAEIQGCEEAFIQNAGRKEE